MALSMPQHTRGGHEQRAHCDSCIGGSGQDHAAEHDDDDAEPSAATDVLLQEPRYNRPASVTGPTWSTTSFVAGVAAPNTTAASAHHAHPFRYVACRRPFSATRKT